MPFRLHLPGGIQVDVDSPEELRAAIAVLRPRPNIDATPATAIRGTLPLEIESLRRFQQTLKGRPQMVLQQLAKAEGAVRDDELRALLNFDSNNQLAGTMAGLAKRAKTQGLVLNQIVAKARIQNGSKRHYTYRLTDAMREAMAE